MSNNFLKDRDYLENIDVIILCGGLGTRLRSIISDRPKILAKIGNLTLLDILLKYISFYGPKNIILCVGHLKEQIKNHISTNYHNYNNGFNIIFSEEEKLLGTGGAIKNANPLIKSDPFIVMNGDSICNIDFREFLNFHVTTNALLSMVLTISLTYQDFGNIILDDSQMIIRYQEKEKVTNSNPIEKNEYLINAGIYLMGQDIFSHMNETTFSLEYEFFPKLINNKMNKCFGFITDGELIDIGIPERYKNAINIIERQYGKYGSRYYRES